MSGLKASRAYLLALLLLGAAEARAQDAPDVDVEAVFAEVSARMDAFEYAEAIGLLSTLRRL